MRDRSTLASSAAVDSGRRESSHGQRARGRRTRPGTRASRSTPRCRRLPGRGAGSRRRGQPPAGPADLLVVGDGRLRGPEVHDKAQVGLVEPMPRALVATSALSSPARSASSAASRSADRPGRYRRDVQARAAQERGGLARRGDGQRVDDAGTRQLGEMARPASPGAAGPSAADNGQVQAVPVQAAPKDQGLAARSPRLAARRRRD